MSIGPDPDGPDTRRAFLSLMDALRHLNYPGSAETIFTRADATGFMGGDAGHGGNAFVMFEQNGGSLGAVVKPMNGGNEIHFDMLDHVTVSVEGDWEQTDLLRGLVKAAAILARVLYARQEDA